MYSQEAVVNNQVGLHARPATFFIQKANEFKHVEDVASCDEVFEFFEDLLHSAAFLLSKYSSSL